MHFISVHFLEHEKTFERLRFLTKLQEESLKVPLVTSSSDISDIPFVHPRMIKVKFYKPRSSVGIDEAYTPSNQSSMNKIKVSWDKEVQFNDLVTDQYRSKFIGLIGFPGSGKTVLSKRLANASKLVTFYLRFMDINYDPDYKLTLRELLLDNMFPHLSEEERVKAFDWIVRNDKDVAIVIDGYDQAEWRLTINPPKLSMNSKLSISNLVANLCNKHFLPGSTFIITSRPHTMITLPKELRPQVTIMLQDFSFENTKKLFFALAGSAAESAWKTLNVNAPHLLSFCQNPLMLSLVLRSFTNFSGDTASIKTMTAVFTNVLEDLRYSSHSRHDDIHVIMEQLARIAFKRTQSHSVVITTKDLEAENLSVAAVQDLIIALYGGKREGSKVFDGDTKLFFSHQTLQEYFSALYIAKEMSYSDFKEFVYADLFRPHWDVVRRFLYGILVNSDLKRSKF